MADQTHVSDIDDGLEKHLVSVCMNEPTKLQQRILNINDHLRKAKSERELADKDVSKSTEELGRRMLLLMQTGIAGEALVELDQVRKRKTQVSHQLELTASNKHQMSKRSRDLLEMDGSYTEKEKSLTIQYLNMKTKLKKAQICCETAKSELQALKQQASLENPKHASSTNVERQNNKESERISQLDMIIGC